MKTLWLLVLLACGTSASLPPVRFANAPAVTVVDDRRDVAKQPAPRWFGETIQHYDGMFQRRLTRALELPTPHRALGVNALDEVPDSTWFTNRIGIRELSLDELRTGPNRIDSPEFHKPWTIKSTKIGGSEIGFIIKDARGIKFMIKFDAPGLPEQETAAHVIVGKLFWACGYNVTEDFVVKFRRDDLLLAPDAVVKGGPGKESKLDRATLEKHLAKLDIDADGQIRAMASRWLDGKSLGGFPGEGVRADDPNDLIPHERRRDLRGAQPIMAWLDHVDLQESNFLDMWTTDSRDPKRHYVTHYMIDFGKSLGVMSTDQRSMRYGFEYVLDFRGMARALLSAGLTTRAWEDRTQPPLRGIGQFDAASFDPGGWRPAFPTYRPPVTADKYDKFWGAKIMMRLTREQIHAIVETARLSDPRAVEYVTETLVARQRATAAYWFSRVNPLDRFTAEADLVCFDDLLLVYGLGGSTETTRYTTLAYDERGRALGASEVQPDLHGRACFSAPLATTGDGYTIVKITTIRPGFTGTTFVHLARAWSVGAVRVIGIWRP
jgi:hypothetical protein